MSQPNMLQFFKPGDTLYGYCGGAFGRDAYSDKICVSVRPLYAVFEFENGTATVLHMSDLVTEADVREWKTPRGDDE